MKTPSFLLIAALLASALPAAAERKPEQRCDREFLERALAALSRPGGIVNDARVETVGDALKLKFGHEGTCDKSVWRHLATEEPVGEPVRDQKTGQLVGGTALRWRNPKLGELWGSGTIVQQIGVLLAADDFYKAIDAHAAAIIAAADEYYDAAQSLGLALVTAPEKKLVEFMPSTTGGALGQSSPKLIAVHDHDKQTPARLLPGDFGDAVRRISGESKTPGASVVKFRVAVLSLASDLDRLGRSRDAVAQRVPGAPPELRDLLSGLPEGFTAVPADAANANSAEKYGAVLARLIGAERPGSVYDQGLRGGALDAIDLGLRNAISAREEAAKALIEAAAARLGGKTVAQIEAGMRVAQAAGEQKTKGNALAASTLEALAGDKDYQDLDRLYHDALRRAGGDAGKLKPEEKAVGEALQRIQAAAATAVTRTGDKAEISYTLDGKADGRRVTMPSVVPADVEGDERARRDAAADIARDIVAGNLGDAKVAAALAALRGQEPRADAAPEGVKPPVAADPPPKPATAWDALADSSDAGCGVNPANLMRGKAERAALRQNERAAEGATEMSEARRRLQDELRAELQAVNDACDRKIADIRAKPRSARLTAEAKAAQIQEEINAAEAECNGLLEAKEKAYAPRIEAVKRETQDANARQALVRAEGERAKWYEEGVPQALDELLEDYTKGDRRAALVARTFDDETVNEDVARFFRDLPASFRADCAKALGYDADPANGRFSDPAKLKDPVAGEVEKTCRASVSVHKDKVAGVKAACKAEYAAVADGAEKQLLTAPLKDALCAAVAAKMGSRGTSGSAPAPVERRRATIPGGE